MASAFAIVLMTAGGAYAWGGGGALFGLGLWITIACAAESIERAIVSPDVTRTLRDGDPQGT